MMSDFASNLGSNLVANIASDDLSSNSLFSSGIKSLFKMTPKGKLKVGSRALDDALEVMKNHNRYIPKEHRQSLSRRIKDLWDERSKYPSHIHLLDIRTQLKIASQADAFMIACLKVHRDAKRVSKESVLDEYIKDSDSPPGNVPTPPLALDTSEGESSQAAVADFPEPAPVPCKRLPPPVPPRRALNTSEGEAVDRPTLVNDPPGPPPPPSPRTSPPTLEIPNSGSLHEPNVNASTSRASPSRRRPPLPPPPSPSKSPVYPPPTEPDFPEEDPFAG